MSFFDRFKKKEKTAARSEASPAGTPAESEALPSAAPVSDNEKYIYIMNLQKVYIPFFTASQPPKPFLTRKGSVIVSESKETVRMLGELRQEYAQLVTLTHDDFLKYVHYFYRYGITKFDFYFADGSKTEVLRDDFLPIDGITGYDYIGSRLNIFMMLINQSGYLFKRNLRTEKEINALDSQISHELYRTVFLIPFAYEDEPENTVVEDSVIHVTEQSAELLTHLQVQRKMKADSGSREESPFLTYANDGLFIIEDEAGNPIYSYDKKYLFGSENYHFITENDCVHGGLMHPTSVTGADGKPGLCAFTDFDSLHALFGSKVHVTVQTFKELIEHMSDHMANGEPVSYLVINPGTNGIRMSTEDLGKIAIKNSMPAEMYPESD